MALLPKNHILLLNETAIFKLSMIARFEIRCCLFSFLLRIEIIGRYFFFNSLNKMVSVSVFTNNISVVYWSLSCFFALCKHRYLFSELQLTTVGTW